MRRRGSQWLLGPDNELYQDPADYERAWHMERIRRRVAERRRWTMVQPPGEQEDRPDRERDQQ